MRPSPGERERGHGGAAFFFRVTLKRPEALAYIPIAREPQRLPVVLTQPEVARLLEAAPGLKWRTALGVADGSGTAREARLPHGAVGSERFCGVVIRGLR